MTEKYFSREIERKNNPPHRAKSYETNSCLVRQWIFFGKEILFSVHFIPLKPFHFNLHIFSLFYILELSYLANWNIRKYSAKRKHRNFCHWKWRKWVSYAMKSSRLWNKLNSRTLIWFHRSTQQGKTEEFVHFSWNSSVRHLRLSYFFQIFFHAVKWIKVLFYFSFLFFFICIDLIKPVMSTDYSVYIRKFSNPIKFLNASSHRSNSMT